MTNPITRGNAYFCEFGEINLLSKYVGHDNTSRSHDQAVEGWSKSGETRIFPSQHLFEYIDGDAERYLKAGVEQTLTSDYRYRDKIDAVADVFIMKNAAGATEVFESQPANGSEWVQVGDAARIYPGTLMFRKGRVFVRLVAYASGPEIQSALLSLARSIGDKIQ